MANPLAPIIHVPLTCKIHPSHPTSTKVSSRCSAAQSPKSSFKSPQAAWVGLCCYPSRQFLLICGLARPENQLSSPHRYSMSGRCGAATVDILVPKVGMQTPVRSSSHRQPGGRQAPRPWAQSSPGRRPHWGPWLRRREKPNPELRYLSPEPCPLQNHSPNPQDIRA